MGDERRVVDGRLMEVEMVPSRLDIGRLFEEAVEGLRGVGEVSLEPCCVEE